MVAVAVRVLFVVSVIRVASHGEVMVIMIVVPSIMVVMVMGVHAQSRYILVQMSVQVRRRRPGELERNNENDNQGDEATHDGHSTELIVSIKSWFTPVPVADFRQA